MGAGGTDPLRPMSLLRTSGVCPQRKRVLPGEDRKIRIFPVTAAIDTFDLTQTYGRQGDRPSLTKVFTAVIWGLSPANPSAAGRRQYDSNFPCNCCDRYIRFNPNIWAPRGQTLFDQSLYCDIPGSVPSEPECRRAKAVRSGFSL